eukprot:Gregarina_sp_Pseudo_9__1417@NODE_1949_length_1237_cov_9_101002_g1806_i0_p1_GENE_NODE_1949_length_1237_cov_9_101002_g1806_i0NODE_1949_length_1237_cov_9_101002_g1806_i0_p1_ORF_typecomplete_len302_score21_82Hydrolase_3/PF08282_12/3e43S6PP/PF05116_13/4_9S6PP/PF05116_13/2_5e05HAD/PF12710_7/43HAD/PF12710_7/0_0016_NODE_1949_length_1237_cov_9_101002_g1806_i02061111
MSSSKAHPISLIATDMDGTFLSQDHGVDSETQSLYRRLHSEGIQVVPATGRSPWSLRRLLEANAPNFLQEMRLFPGVYLNGTCVFGSSPDDVVYAHKMTAEALVAICSAYYNLVSRNEIKQCALHLQHVHGSYVDVQTPYFLSHRDHWYEEIPEETGQSMLNLLNSVDHAWCQLTVVGEPEQISYLGKKLLNDPELTEVLKENEIQVLLPTPPLITILPTSESKAKGIRKLIERFPKWSLDNLLTIGDGDNDVEMLKLAPWSVAMGQASDSVKSAAKTVAPTSADQGWVKSVKSLVFEEQV